ncbi:MAG: hypothetical protein ACK559_30565, partial [bacterium]
MERVPARLPGGRGGSRPGLDRDLAGLTSSASAAASGWRLHSGIHPGRNAPSVAQRRRPVGRA